MKDPILFRSRLFWFLLAAAIIATRHLGDLVVPQLRDEDGLVYFQQALAWGGWRMILWPYGGYLNVLPRFFAALLRPIPLEWAPLAYNFSALIVVAALSGPEGIVLTPFTLLRAWQWRRSWQGLLMLGGVWFGTAVQCVIFLSDPRQSEAQWRAAVPSVGILSRYAKLLFGGWFGSPYDGRVAAAVFAMAVACMAGIWIARGQQHRWPAVLVLLGGLAFLGAGRVASANWGHPFGFGSRHIFLPYAAVFWSLGWLAAGIDGWRRVGPILLAAAVIASALPNWTADVPPDLHWREQVAALRAGRTIRTKSLSTV